MPGLDRTGLKNTYLRTLTENEVDRIHQGALRTLAKTGLSIPDDIILTLLSEAGCRVSHANHHAQIPETIVEEALDQAPSVVNLYNRMGERVMELGAGSLHARTSSGATGVLDLKTGIRRDPTCQDAADAVRVADALPHIHGVSTMAVQPAEVPVRTVDVHSMRIALTNTIKPLGYVCLNQRLIDPVIEMATVAAGGEKALRERPIITALAESTSPLQLVSSQLAVLRAFASRGLPLTLHAHPMAGLTAPVSLAGELVITHAEILSLVTITQLIRLGTPVIYGMSSSVPNMRSGINLSGAVEIGLLGGAVARLAKRCGLPCLMSSGTDAHQPGAQAILERLMTLLPPALAGIDLINLSTLDTKMSFSLQQLVIDNSILDIIAHYLRGITVNDKSLALSLIEEIGPGGAFIDTEHTLDHFRNELLVPDLVSRETRKVWEEADKPHMPRRARERADYILREHFPPSLPAAVTDQLDEIVNAAEKQGETFK